MQDQPAAEPNEDQVEEAKGHGRSSCPTADLDASPQLTGTADFWHPTAAAMCWPGGPLRPPPRRAARVQATHRGPRRHRTAAVCRQCLRVTGRRQAPGRRPPLMSLMAATWTGATFGLLMMWLAACVRGGNLMTSGSDTLRVSFPVLHHAKQGAARGERAQACRYSGWW